MTPELADYIEAGKALDAVDRLEVARQLLLSVESVGDSDQAETAAAWDDAVDRRVSEVVSGAARLVDGREAHARVRAEVAALGK